MRKFDVGQRVRFKYSTDVEAGPAGTTGVGQVARYIDGEPYPYYLIIDKSGGFEPFSEAELSPLRQKPILIEEFLK